MKKLVIFGAGQLAELAVYYFSAEGGREIAGLTTDRDYLPGTEIFGLPVKAFEDIIEFYPPSDFDLFVAVGYGDGNKTRQRIATKARDLGYELATFVSPSAVNQSIELGVNSAVFDTAVVQPFSRVGDGCLIKVGAIIGHHARVGNYCYIGPNATICGTCILGERVFVGAGASIRDQCSVVSDTVIGVGSVVTGDITEPGVYIGAPARRLPDRG